MEFSIERSAAAHHNLVNFFLLNHDDHNTTERSF